MTRTLGTPVRIGTAVPDPARVTQGRWPAKTAVPPERMGRFVNSDEAFARWGEDAMRVFFDGSLTSDDLAYEVLEDLQDITGGKALIERALDHGIESVPEAPESLVRLFKQVDTIPEWVDFDQINRGAVAYFRGGPMVSIVFTCAVVAAANHSVSMTRELAFSARFDEKAFIRAQETFRWLLAACRPDGMRRHNPGFKYTVQVRMLHAHIRRAVMKSGRWDWDTWGMPISDTNGVRPLAYSFTTGHLDALTKIGFRFSDQEQEDVYALWRYVGYVIGVPEERLFRNGTEARQFHEIYHFVDPGPDDDCRKLVSSLIDLATPLDGSSAVDVFPAPLTKILPPMRMRKMMYGLLRYWTGDAEADLLRVPRSRWKYLGHVIRPFVLGFEVARRVFGIDDVKTATKTIDLLDRSVMAQPGQSALAPPEELLASVAANLHRFAKQ